MEQLLSLTLFGSTLYFYGAVFILIGFLFYSEIEENGFIALCAVLLFIGANYLRGNMRLDLTWLDAVIYFLIGVGYAFVRTFFWGREQGIRLNKERKDYEEDKIKKIYKKEFEDTYYYRAIMSESKLKDHFFRWMSLWPISLIKWLCTKWFGEIFNWIYDSIKESVDAIREAGFKSVK